MMRHGERERCGVMEEARDRRLAFDRFKRPVPIALKAAAPKPLAKRIKTKRMPRPGVGCDNPSFRPLIEAVVDATGYTFHNITEERRGGNRMAKARQLAVGLVDKHRPGLSLKALGRIFSRDHTTIIASLAIYHNYHQVEPMRTWLEHAAIRGLK